MLSQVLKIAGVVTVLVALGTCAATTETMQDPDAWAGEAAAALAIAESLQRDVPDLRWQAGDAEAWLAALTTALGVDTWEVGDVGPLARRLTAYGFESHPDADDYGVVGAWLSTVQDAVSLAGFDGAIEDVPAGRPPVVGWVAPGERSARLTGVLDRLVALVAPGRP